MNKYVKVWNMEFANILNVLACETTFPMLIECSSCICQHKHLKLLLQVYYKSLEPIIADVKKRPLLPFSIKFIEIFSSWECFYSRYTDGGLLSEGHRSEVIPSPAADDA